MVNPINVFIGEDTPSKDVKLRRLREEYLPKRVENFNLDILYARELNLHAFQERVLALPVQAKKRIIVVKEADRLKENIKEFILKFARKPPSTLLLILDIARMDSDEDFIRRLSRYSQVFRFRERLIADTFALGRQIKTARPDYALRTLNQLLKQGKKPEWIVGGLRYLFERDNLSLSDKRLRLKVLLDCDIDIKTGRLKPAFAMERLVVKLCSLGRSLR